MTHWWAIIGSCGLSVASLIINARMWLQQRSNRQTFEHDSVQLKEDDDAS